MKKNSVKELLVDFGETLKNQGEDEALKLVGENLDFFPKETKAKLFGLIFGRQIGKLADRTERENEVKQTVISLMKTLDEAEEMLKAKEKVLSGGVSPQSTPEKPASQNPTDIDGLMNL